MTNAQIMALTDIQRMALAAHEQTGRQIRHEIETFADGGTWSVVGIYGADNTSLYYSRVSIEADGSEMPEPGNPESPSTLSEQRLALAEWIAANRKEAAA
ncbi:hypothetical protein A8U91_01293 [Halomonas elongata]|uniref:Uncharacterized protein n=1 Tax=Halomonas elongata TaxID=2746 RepID=A0A1B8P3U6_HALEL|nr:hypothetical protein [Halomonas elongata]OBX36945.1 hypothetical protein A8U91_01293 [Halomonas elongata]